MIHARSSAPTGSRKLKMTVRSRPGLPLAITPLACLVLIIAAWNVVRLVTSLSWLGPLETYAPWPGALYIGATGLVWALAGALLARALWHRSWWALIALRLAALAYAGWVWFDRLMVQSGPGSNWIFALATTVALLAYTWAVTLDARMQAHFGREAD